MEVYWETSVIISTGILKIIENYNPKNKVVALSADNTNCNFGGLKRKAGENVLTKLKSNLGKSVLGLGSVAHIVHNSGYTAINCVPINVEGTISKIFRYFHIYTVRVAKLKDFCEFVNQEYYKTLGHVSVKWLSLIPALQRVSKMYGQLKLFFFFLRSRNVSIHLQFHRIKEIRC